MTPQDQENWKSNIINWTPENLKADSEFMRLSGDRDFAAWAFSLKPELKRKREPKIKFLGLKPTAEKEPEKTVAVQIVEEVVEEVPKAVQFFRDVVKMRDGLL